MNGMRKVLCFVTAMMLAAVSLPAVAASGNNKVYTLNMTTSLPGNALPGNASGQSVTADFGNISPDGNSTYKSLKLFAPPGITITGVTVPAGFTASPTIRDAAGAIVAQGTAVWVDVINLPVKPFGPHFVLGLTVNTSCAGGGAWSTKNPNDRPNTEQVWSGTGWAGQNFAYTSGNLTTNITGACSMSISGPTSAVAGSPFTMTVTLNGGPGGNVTLSSSCGFTGDGTTLATGNSAAFTGSVATEGTCTFNASAAAYSPAPPLSITVYHGMLGCADTNNYATSRVPASFDLDPNVDTAYIGAPGWGLRRGPNYDGSTCQLVNFTCSLDQVNKVLSCVYDKQMQQKVVLKYVVLWPAVSILNDGTADVWKAFRPQVAWGQGLSTPPSLDQYVPGLNCIDDNYTLGELLLPTIPNITPFQGNPYPQYLPNQLARMCIAQLGSTSIGKDPNDPTKLLLQPWNKVVDEADGFVGLP